MPAGVIAGETLNNGDEGLGLINGFINGVNTSAFAAGDSVYVAVGGGYTNIRPTGSAVLVQKLGNVEKSALNGSGVINGPGYYNDLPNIQQGYTWVGNTDGVAIAIATSSIQNVVSASYAATSSYATQFNVATGLTASGLIYPSADNGNESYIQTDGAGNLSLQYVKSMYETVRNRETFSITAGIPLFVSGATGANSDVYVADASNPARMPASYVASETIAPSGTGKALIAGLLTNINTTAYQAGQELFTNTGSGITTSRPPYPNSVQLLGIVTRVGINGQAVILNPGQIEIQNIQPGYTLVGNSIGTPTAVATASLSVASASFASTASYVNTLNQIVRVGNDIELDNQIGAVVANSFDAGLGNVFIDGLTGEVTATTFIGDLTGTASYATQALSASYAPSTPTFPYTGSAIISGSLVVTGSLTISGSSTLTNIGPAQFSGSFGVQGAGDGFNGPFTAITIDDANFTRTLHDSQMGSSSLDFGNRSLVDGSGNFVLSWDGIVGYINSTLYSNNMVSDTTRNTLLTGQAHAGQTLDGVAFDTNTVLDFDLVYLETDGIWYPVNQATASSTKLLGICLGYDPGTGLGTVILEGDVSVSTGPGSTPVVDNANYGLPVYIAYNAGNTMDTTIPVNGYVRVLGHCYYSDGGANWIMKFRPSNEWIEL